MVSTKLSWTKGGRQRGKVNKSGKVEIKVFRSASEISENEISSISQ